MSFVDLYGNSEHRKNVAHFAAIATLAAVDGEVNPEEEELLIRFAQKLDITELEYKEIMSKPTTYPIDPPTSSERRLERLFDLFRIIFVDHMIDDDERILIKKYAIGLGYTTEAANKIITRSINIFGGQIDFEDYVYLVKH
ncbi:TerB family tellurite resistance protein [Flavobacteriaceae bacterium KMM 6897]|nr:TerB family tellurite resistance protein [Flavobacteriaceae bacterium KMM 6897]MEB8346556.1 TerB family tellurite resistance protein [Flavobacteriaceae bacterium KMM 6898]